MSTTSLFNNNRTQAVRLPAEMRFPDGIKKVEIRQVGQERIIAPAGKAWDSFFLEADSRPSVSDDFMTDRASQTQTEREDF